MYSIRSTLRSRANSDHNGNPNLPELQAEEQTNSLNTVVASIHVVPKEQVIGVWKAASNAEQLQEIIQLPIASKTECGPSFAPALAQV